MKLKLKTTFWEELNLDKIAKLIFFLTIIQIMNVIGWYWTQGLGFLTMINTGITAFLLMITLSYQKHEKEIKEKRREKDNND